MNLKKIKESIENFEGLELKPYTCPLGRLTIGFGRNLQDNGITKSEAEMLLDNDLLNTKLELEDRLPIFTKLDDVRQDVLIQMAYNMGVPKLLGFKKTIGFLETAVFYFNRGEVGSAMTAFQYASREMLNSKWHKKFVELDMQDGKRNNGGLLRSEYLSKLMKEGKY